MNCVACCGTDIGTCRKVNQDAVSIKTRQIHGTDCYMAIVCDGVGGLAQGEYASSCMRERLERWFLYEYPQITVNDETDKIIQERLKKTVDIQNKVLYEYGKRQGIRCATTVSALLWTGQKYFIVHVGDSRIYLLDGKVKQLTEDQTLAAREVKLGVLQKEDVQKDVRQNVILQSVGAERSVNILTYCGYAGGDFSFLVCTDGFYHHADKMELSELFYEKKYNSSDELGRKIEGLIRCIKERGEQDNISIAVIQCRENMLIHAHDMC